MSLGRPRAATELRLPASELPKDRIRVNCIGPAAFSLCSFYNTCQSGDKATAALLGKGGSPQYGFRAIMAKQPIVLTDEITPRPGACRPRGAAGHYWRLRRTRQPPLSSNS